jgi:putative ABC transport system permease protein
VVGVVKNAATGGLMMEATTPIYYAPSTANFSPAAILRVSRPATALPTLRQIVSGLDPRLPPVDLVNVEDAMADSIAGPRFTMTLIAVFTALAVLLAAVGLFGLVSYTVVQRTREIGIRIALGARPGDVVWRFMRQGLVATTAGLASGLIAARAGAHLLSNWLVGVPPGDVVAFAIAATAVAGTALLACSLPARRAADVDPIIALRAE